ncbi:MAG: methylated-DNA--[protein]-cysteine S-methyltransferase [Verrucomicrobiota bacterium]
MSQSVCALSLATPAGVFRAEYTDSGLAGLNFPLSDGAQSPPAASRLPPPAIRHWHNLTKRAVTAVLAGKTPAQLPPLDLSQGTAFQQGVWSALQNIASGQTRSYGEIAAELGKPKAARAVGAACGANPIPLLIPCHRVLAAGGKLGGFSGGLEWKRRLLEREGMLPSWR